MYERFILIGFLLFVVVVIPVLLVRDYRHRKKVRQIMDSYRSRNSEKRIESEKGTGRQQEGDAPKGWGMNNSPFRERKSGLTWGGGNIKASEAKRGTRRKFLK